MLASSPIAAHRAVGDREGSGVGDAAGIVPALVTVNGAVGNRQRPIVRNAAANAGREVGARHTSEITAHTAVGNHHYPYAVVNAATLATRGKEVCKAHPVVGYGSVYDRQCRAAAIVVLVVYTTPTRGGTIHTDSAVYDRQCRAAA